MEHSGGRRSHELSLRASKCVPGGVHSNVRLARSDMFFSRGAGARIWDADGAEYIDYVLGQGRMLLGHANAAIDASVMAACADGMVFGAQHPLEVEAAELFLATTGWAERVRFSMTGSEAVHGALRVARAATGRQKFVRFIGGYHGWLDSVLLAPDAEDLRPGSLGQSPSALSDSILLRWNDLAALERVLDAEGSDIAAVIMEPVMFNAEAIEPVDGYLEGVRAACTRHGVVLIFDEVITGFRLALGGAVEYYGVEPDLATYGKALAGGWPVAAFAGRAEVMDVLIDGRVNHSGTFNGSVMASAAIVATLSLLRADPPYERIAAYGRALMAKLDDLGQQTGVPLLVQGLPVAFHVAPNAAAGADESLGTLELHRALADNGVWVTTRGIWYVSGTHGQPELDETTERAGRALRALASTHERLEELSV